LKPLPGGVYRINDRMIEACRHETYSTHASNLGALLAKRIAGEIQLPAFIVDPVTTDEMLPAARISGVPGIERQSRSHALNIKYCIRKTSSSIDLPVEDSRFIAAHLGSGFSIAAVLGGRIIDVTTSVAKQIGFYSRGLTPCKVEVLELRESHAASRRSAERNPSGRQ